MKRAVGRSSRFFPRFGIPALFATMLLAISVAGWWKFHRNLYLEEQAVLAELAAADCEVRVWYEFPERERESDADDEGFQPAEWQKLFTRIKILGVSGDPPQALRRRIATLPELQILDIRPFWFMGDPPVPPKPLPPVSEIVNAPAPTFVEPTLHAADLDRPIEEGDRMSEEEELATLAAIRDAWTRPPSVPERYVRLVEALTVEPGERPTLFGAARDGEAFLTFNDLGSNGLFPQPLYLSDGSTSYALGRTPRGLTFARRYLPSVPAHAKPGLSAEEFLKPPVEAYRGLLPEDLEHVASIDRLGEGRVRLTFKPFDWKRRPEPPYRAGTESVLLSQAVLRSDLDWVVESIRELSKRGAEEGYQVVPTRIEQESRYVRIGERVLPLETLTRTGADDGSIPLTVRTRFAWSLDPEFGESTFDPNRLLDKPLPPPRELPLWRWYRATFAMSLALFAYLIGRSLLGAFRRKVADEAPASSPADSERPEEPLAASTPGA